MSGGKTFFSVESGHPYEPIQSQDAKLDDAVSNKSKSLKLIALAGLWLSAAVITALLVINFLYPPQPRLEGTLSPGPAFKLVSHPEPPTSYWGTVSKPYPTGAFWTNLVVKTGDYPVAVLPYGVKTVDAGIQVSYGPTRRSVSQTTISDPFVCDLQFSATQAFVSRSVESYDNISVSVGFHTAGGGKYKTYLVKGSPFVTVTYDGATPVISSSLMRITNVEPRLVKGSTSGSQYIVSLGNYQKWLVYCSPATTLTWQGDSLTSSTAMKGFIRVAILPVQNLEVALSTLLMYVQRYPTGATVSITHPSGTTAQLTYQFTTVGTGPLLMLALPHHVQNMVFPNLMDPAGEGNQAQSYEPVYCIKGKMRPVVGDTWRMQFNLVNVGWNYDLSDKMSTTQLDEIARNLLSDVGSIFPSAVDIYGFGKQLGRMAQLALLADNLGIAEPRQEALSAIEVTLNPWIQDVTQDGLQYDRTYGGVVTAIGITDINTDYGSGWYNDHHFQLGYLVFASAVIARFDVPYFQANKIYLDSIVKDICNPDPTDTDFPFFRHKDLFDFHSWASGLAQQSNGKSQESSSEVRHCYLFNLSLDVNCELQAVNAYYACYLYGLATANTYLTQASQTMLTMEIIAAQLYWHMPNSNIYDSLFAANVMAGNVGGFDVTASTWFGAKPEYIHGINMLVNIASIHLLALL